MVQKAQERRLDEVELRQKGSINYLIPILLQTLTILGIAEEVGLDHEVEVEEEVESRVHLPHPVPHHEIDL